MAAPHPILRFLKDADLPDLRLLEQTVFQYPVSPARWEPEIRNPACLFAGAYSPEGNLLGFAIGLVASDELDIHLVAVHPDQRRQGMGRRLLTFLLEHAAQKKARMAWLEVRQSDTAAQAFYLAVSFKAVRQRKGYFSQPREDALCMARPLAAP